MEGRRWDRARRLVDELGHKMRAYDPGPGFLRGWFRDVLLDVYRVGARFNATTKPMEPTKHSTDASTHALTWTDPSGITHQLLGLPDQVVVLMRSAFNEAQRIREEQQSLIDSFSLGEPPPRVVGPGDDLTPDYTPACAVVSFVLRAEVDLEVRVVNCLDCIAHGH